MYEKLLADERDRTARCERLIGLQAEIISADAEKITGLGMRGAVGGEVAPGEDLHIEKV